MVIETCVCIVKVCYLGDVFDFSTGLFDYGEHDGDIVG